MSKDNEFLSMCITVARHHMKEEDPQVAWGECQKPLTLFVSPADGSLIEAAHGCLQVDFANAYIGGGVLNLGNVQVIEIHIRRDKKLSIITLCSIIPQSTSVGVSNDIPCGNHSYSYEQWCKQ